MRTILFCILTLGVAISSSAQFYPENNARWCGVDADGGPPLYDVQLQMGLMSDTLINGTVYKRVDEYRDYSFERSYFVRSDKDGKGYAFLPDSSAEYLTGDTNANAGDTVHNVLWSNTSQFGVEYILSDMVIDTVVTLTYDNVTVVRQLFESLPTGEAFWQAGMGTSDGPMLEYSGAMLSCMVGDTAMYNSGSNIGLGPIGVNLCPLLDFSDGIEEGAGHTSVRPTPNPSTGLFHFHQATGQITVYNAQGVLLFQTHGNEVDLGAYPPGVYTAVIRTARGNGVQRLVVVR